MCQTHPQPTKSIYHHHWAVYSASPRQATRQLAMGNDQQGPEAARIIHPHRKGGNETNRG